MESISDETVPPTLPQGCIQHVDSIQVNLGFVQRQVKEVYFGRCADGFNGIYVSVYLTYQEVYVAKRRSGSKE